MSQPPRQFFTVTDFDSLSVTTALVQDDILTIAKGDHSLSLPTLIALDIAAETIRLLLDDDDITNGPGLSLSEWLGDDDSEEAAMFDPGRFPPAPAACYRAPWRLPGPDSHRLAVFQAHAWVRRRVHHFCFLAI